MKCPTCKSEMVDMIFSSFCKNDCDRRPAAPVPLTYRVGDRILVQHPVTPVEGVIVDLHKFQADDKKWYTSFKIRTDDIDLTPSRHMKMADGTPYNVSITDYYPVVLILPPVTVTVTI